MRGGLLPFIKGSILHRRPLKEAVSIFQALLLVSDGPTFALTASPQKLEEGGGCPTFQIDVVERWRSELADPCKSDSAVVTICQIRVGGGNDVLFSPLPFQAGGDTDPFKGVLLAFVVPQGSVWRATDSFVHHKLPLILDLDETLVCAQSLNQLTKKLANASNQRLLLSQQMKSATSDAERSRLDIALRALKVEMCVLREDRDYLVSFIKTDSVILDGEKWTAHVERVDGVDGIPSRPVIRRPEAGIIFTRIDPMDPNTSMLVRTRPGWEELKAGILGLSPSQNVPKPKFDVFVCTTSQRQYAEEIWRLLDPGYQMIPFQEIPYIPHRPSRIVCVDPADGLGRQQKTLAKALSMGTGGAGFEMPIAIIADDRLDVWEAGARGQIAFVEPFTPYKRAKDIWDELMIKGRSGIEVPWLSLAPLAAHIRNLRSHLFFDRDHALKLRERHKPDDHTLVWPRMRSIKELNEEPNLPAMPRLPEGKPNIVVQLPTAEDENLVSKQGIEAPEIKLEDAVIAKRQTETDCGAAFTILTEITPASMALEKPQGETPQQEGSPLRENLRYIDPKAWKKLKLKVKKAAKHKKKCMRALAAKGEGWKTKRQMVLQRQALANHQPQALLAGGFGGGVSAAEDFPTQAQLQVPPVQGELPNYPGEQKQGYPGQQEVQVYPMQYQFQGYAEEVQLQGHTTAEQQHLQGHHDEPQLRHHSEQQQSHQAAREPHCRLQGRRRRRGKSGSKAEGGGPPMAGTHQNKKGGRNRAQNGKPGGQHVRQPRAAAITYSLFGASTAPNESHSSKRKSRKKGKRNDNQST